MLCGVSAGLVEYEKDEENQALLLVVISTTWMGCDGESCCSFSIVTVLPSCCRGKKRWEAALDVGGSQPSEF